MMQKFLQLSLSLLALALMGCLGEMKGKGIEDVESLQENGQQGPRSITLSSLQVEENTSLNFSVAKVIVDDNDSKEHKIQLTSPDGQFFASRSGEVRRTNIALNYELQKTSTITVTATDQDGLSLSKDFTLEVLNVNEAPQLIELSNSMVFENTVSSSVGTFSATDEDFADSHSFQILNEGNNFTVIDGNLMVKESANLDFETMPTLNIEVQVSDAGGMTLSQFFTIQVMDVDETIEVDPEAPSNITLSNNSIDENSAAESLVGILSAEGNDLTGLSFAVSESPFEIVNINELRLKSGQSIDFETQNTYTLNITATTVGGTSRPFPFIITVNDIVENAPPTAIRFAEINGEVQNTIIESAEGLTVVGQLLVEDPDSNQHELVMTDNTFFELIGDQVRLKDGVSLNYLMAQQHSITVGATDAQGGTVSETLTIFVEQADLNTQVQALFSANCYSCHGNGANVGGLEGLEQFGTLVEKGYIIPGDPDASYLYRRIADNTMAPGDPLFTKDPGARNILRQWINQEFIGQVPPTPGGEVRFSCIDENERAATEITRLSRSEYQNTLYDLFSDFGIDLSQDSVLTGKFFILPDDVPNKVTHDYTTKTNWIGQPHIDGYLEVAFRIAEYTTENNSRFSAIGGNLSTCTTCNSDLEAFLDNFGYRLFRRPITDTVMREDLKSAFTSTSGTNQDKMMVLLSIMLQHPEVIYRLKDQGAESTSNVLEMDDYEIASEMSYLFWGSAPDLDLLTRASNGEFRNPASRLAIANTMLENPKAKRQTRRFFSEWMQLDEITAPLRPEFLNGINGNGLTEAMQQEIHDYLDYIVYDSNGSFADLYTSKQTFINHDGLAAIYDLNTNPGGAHTLQGDHRIGLLGKAGFLAREGLEHQASFLRGADIINQVTCGSIDLPNPDDIPVEELFDFVPDPAKTNRENKTEQTNNTRCASCHNQINSYGFAFENFDGIGRYMASETVSNNGQESQVPIDASTTIYTLRKQEVIQVNSAADLQREIASSTEAQACMVKQYFRFANQKQEEMEDGCYMNEMLDGLYGPNGSDGTIKDMMLKTVESSQFTKRRLEN